MSFHAPESKLNPNMTEEQRARAVYHNMLQYYHQTVLPAKRAARDLRERETTWPCAGRPLSVVELECAKYVKLMYDAHEDLINANPHNP